VVAKKSWQKTWDFGGCFGWATKAEGATLEWICLIATKF